MAYSYEKCRDLAPRSFGSVAAAPNIKAGPVVGAEHNVRRGRGGGREATEITFFRADFPAQEKG